MIEIHWGFLCEWFEIDMRLNIKYSPTNLYYREGKVEKMTGEERELDR